MLPLGLKIIQLRVKNLNSDKLAKLLALRPKNSVQKIPVIAIGGISLEQAPQVLATGVDSIAVATAITQAENLEAVVTKLKNMII